MKALRLLYVIIFVVSFSGKPAPANRPLPEAVSFFEGNTREEDETSIPWKKDRRLSWSDFLSQPQRSSDAVASTNTALGISYKILSGEWVYHITCNFTKDKSWGLLKTDYILAHEQAHFDITELYARRLYQQLQEYLFNPRSYKQDISGIYQQIIKDKEAMQDAYDSQTDHSRNKKMQAEWLKKIEDMLLFSEPFADYP